MKYYKNARHSCSIKGHLLLPRSFFVCLAAHRRQRHWAVGLSAFLARLSVQWRHYKVGVTRCGVTDAVTLFFRQKIDDLFSHGRRKMMTFSFFVITPHPLGLPNDRSFRQYTLCKIQPQKLWLSSGCHPLDGVPGAVRPPRPSDATVSVSLWEPIFRLYINWMNESILIKAFHNVHVIYRWN